MEMNTMYTIPSTVAFEPAMYTETSHYVLGHGNNSPTMYPEDSELRIPSSSLSAASAASSAAASPQSNPGQHSVPSPEWATSGLVQPTIVSNDFVAHHPDFGFHAQHMEEMNFEFAPPTKGYVGKSQLISRSCFWPLIRVPVLPCSPSLGGCLRQGSSEPEHIWVGHDGVVLSFAIDRHLVLHHVAVRFVGPTVIFLQWDVC
jgi:hypothetical protein